MVANPTTEDVCATASVCRGALEPLIGADWDLPAHDLEWSCRTTLAHILAALLYYAINFTTRSTELRSSGQADAALPVAELLDALEGRAAVLAEVLRVAPAGARGTHDWGRPDASGFAALACNEMLVHTSDIAIGLGAGFDPTRETCHRVLARLFPWAPLDGEPWETLRWANGRAPLGDRARLSPDWIGHPSPLDEWDRRDPNSKTTGGR